MPAFIVAAAEVIEDFVVFVQMSFRQFFFDLCLSGEQPIQCLVEFVFVRVLHGKFFGERAVVPEPRGGEFGSGIQETLDQHGQHEIAFAAGLGTEQWRELEAAHGAQYGFDMTVRQGTQRVKSFGGREERCAGERTANDVEEGGWEMRDIADGFMLDLIAEAESATEEVGLVVTAFVLAYSCGYMNSTRSRWHPLHRKTME